MAMYRTVSLASWKINSTNLECNNHPLAENQTRQMLFDMSLPYLYLPDDDWDLWSHAIELFDIDIICNSAGWCKLPSPCEFTSLRTWYLQFDLIDNTGTTNNYVLPSGKYLLIPGEVMGDTKETCYLPVFKSDIGD